ncbi:hypothetical protein D3C81_1366370 [compost metagenome]
MQLQRLAAGDQGLAIELAQQVGQVVGHLVDHLQAQGLAGRQADGFAHRLLRPVGVAPAQLCQAADVGRGVIDLLAGEGGFIVAGLALVILGYARRPPYLHGRGGPQVGAGGHGRDVAGIEDIGTGAGGAGPAGGDEAGDRNGAGQDRLDHLAHGTVQATRGVQAQHHQLCALGLCLVEATNQVIGAGRADGVIDAQHPDRARCRLADLGEGQHQRQQQPAPTSSDHLSSPRPHLSLKFSRACRTTA